MGFLELVTPPASNPVTTAEMLSWMKMDSGDDDTNIAAIIAAATSHLDGRDGVLNRALVSQTWRLHLDEFPDEIEVPLPPLVSVGSITYVDGDGTTQTLDSSLYTVSGGYNQPARIAPATDTDWPVTLEQNGAVKVTFTSGYTTVPDALKMAIKILAADMYENRQSLYATRGSSLLETKMMERLIAPYKVVYFY